jgi:hypothetical protein
MPRLGAVKMTNRGAGGGGGVGDVLGERKGEGGRINGTRQRKRG